MPIPNRKIFTILIWGHDRPKVGTLPSEGSRICATGPIQDYRGVREIVVRIAADSVNDWFAEAALYLHPKGESKAVTDSSFG